MSTDTSLSAIKAVLETKKQEQVAKTEQQMSAQMNTKIKTGK